MLSGMITYVSIDIEADGPAPGLNSMLALGAAAFSQEGAELETWYGKLIALPDARTDPDTMSWWDTQPEAWAEVMSGRAFPRIAIPKFASWCESLPGKPVAVAKPAAYDFAWVNYYLWRFAGRNPLGFSCRDMGSYADGMNLSREEQGEIYRSIDRTGLRPHIAVDDAIEQGRYWIALRAKARAGAR